LLSIDITFTFKDTEFSFKAEIELNKPYTFEIGETALTDKLFWVLVGLDKSYKGKINGEGICFNPSSWNNVLALGDKTMFVRGSVYKNIYKALRVRANKKAALERTEQVIDHYDLRHLSKLNIKLLTQEELLRVAVARAHFRKIALIVAKECEIDFSKWKDSYIIKII